MTLIKTKLAIEVEKGFFTVYFAVSVEQVVDVKLFLRMFFSSIQILDKSL
jgi:hypothetical protein